MHRPRFLLLVAVAVTGVVLGVSTAARADPPSEMYGLGGLFVTNVGTTCPGFAPYIPEDAVAVGPGEFHTGYFYWPAGEYLWLPTPTITAGGVFFSQGSGVPLGHPGWTPTSDHTYKAIAKFTGPPEGPLTPGRITIIRDDGASISADATFLTDGNHSILLTWVGASCHLH